MVGYWLEAGWLAIGVGAVVAGVGEGGKGEAGAIVGACHACVIVGSVALYLAVQVIKWSLMASFRQGGVRIAI